MLMNDSDYSIIIPVYNGASYLADLIKRIPVEFHQHLLFIDDGSEDNTVNVLNGLNLQVICHPKNKGKGSALQTGMKRLKQSKAAFCITMDVDLQHSPALLPDFVKSFDPMTITLGYRQHRKQMPLHRRISNFLTSLLVSVRTHKIIKDSQCGYRLIPNAMFHVPYREAGFQFESELLIKGCLSGFRVKHIPIPTIYNEEDSAINPLRDTLMFTTVWLRSFFWS